MVAVFASIVVVILAVGFEVLHFAWFNQRFDEWSDQANLAYPGQLLSDIGTVVAALALAVVVPFVIRQYQSPTGATSESPGLLSRLIRWLPRLGVLILLAAPITVVIVGLWARDRDWAPGAEQQARLVLGEPRTTSSLGPPVLAAALILFVVLAVLMWTVVPGWRAMLGALIGVIAAIDLVLLVDLVHRPGTAGRAISAAVLFATIFWLLLTLAGLTVASTTHGTDWWSGRRWWRKAAIGVALLVLALPYSVLLDHLRTVPSSWESIYELAGALTRLLLMVAVVWIVLWLKDSSERNGSRLPETALWLGLLLAILTVFRPTFRFLYVPVAALVGVAMLRYWLYREPPAVVQDGRAAHDEVRAALLDAAATLRRAQKRVDQARHEQAQVSLDKEEATQEQDTTRVKAAEDQLAQLKRTQQATYGAAGDKVGLNIGPCPTPWLSP